MEDGSWRMDGSIALVVPLAGGVCVSVGGIPPRRSTREMQNLKQAMISFDRGGGWFFFSF